ncbi:MAG: hypothetical protein ACRDPE_23720 [Solirubrobacterales bacterium]
MVELPVIACTLAAPELEARLRGLAEIGERSLLARGRVGSTQVLRFRCSEAVRASLREMAEAERLCCPFLVIELAERDEELLLVIDAPPEAAAVAEGLATAFGTPPAA